MRIDSITSSVTTGVSKVIVSFELLDVATVFSSLLVEVSFELYVPHATRRKRDNRATPIPINFFVLGIIAIVYYKGDNRVGAAPSVLMIVFGGVSLIPFLGWVGGILVIIGGSLFLATLKKFKSEE
ncbi:integral membrane protein [Streptococcus pneumoniae]|nr:integral membrane protein [Streptococcus pneumoniae]